MTSWVTVALCAVVSLLTLLFLLRRVLIVVSVVGTSMLPHFQPGDRLLVRRGAAARRLRAGTVAVLRRPFPRDIAAATPFLEASASPISKQLVIKRVAALPGDCVPESVLAAADGVAVVPRGMVVLLADNPAGSDSRSWGLVPLSYVIGCVVSRLSST
jgi:signal peptidase I